VGSEQGDHESAGGFAERGYSVAAAGMLRNQERLSLPFEWRVDIGRMPAVKRLDILLIA